MVTTYLDLLGSSDVINHVASFYRWSFQTIALFRVVVEILYVKHLAKHIPIENALIPIFVLGAKLGFTVFCNFVPLPRRVV